MQQKSSQFKLPEVWGGVECTVNRVQDSYFDQLRYNGHHTRIADLERFASLGLRALRYPVLWERVAPEGLESADWSWAAERLHRIRELGMRPIAGFVHHGSGPRHTSLLDPAFATKLASYAAEFARRFPWVEDFTPINEPFTTARFSALYGVWYPHHRDYRSCFTALVNECRGTALAMREIRKVNPAARLIQTDDLGKCSSTPALSYQADFENERRWIGWDLLCGKVVPGHPLWETVLSSGVTESDILWFAENPCPPDVIGVNHYLLSNRHLDERMERYPSWSHGGNERDRYADVESVRIADARFIPPKTIFQEAWERYRIPLAITEVHVDAAREDQLRWFMEIWNSCQELIRAGADIRAVTAWGLLGHFDWHCLVSRCEGYYEAGVYDLRSPEPRPTAIAGMLRELSQTGTFDHPVLQAPGWWRRPARIRHPEPIQPPEPGSVSSFGRAPAGKSRRIRPLLITGARGTLGKAFGRVCERRGLPYRLLSREELDIGEPRSVLEALESIRPWAVVNAAGYVRVDQAETERTRCFRENADGPALLAQACGRSGIRLATFSSDLVFAGDARKPYLESSPVRPLNAYGESKAAAERAVLKENPEAMIIRTSSFFGPWDEHNFVTGALSSIRTGDFRAAEDVTVSPTFVPDLVETTLNLLLDGEHGIWHLANAGECTWLELARKAASLAGLDPARVQAVPVSELGLAAPRPSYSALASERATLMPALDSALERFMNESNWRKRSWQKPNPPSESSEQASLEPFSPAS